MFAFFPHSPFTRAGMGLANTLSAAFNTVLLIYALRRGPKFGVAEVAGHLQGISPASAVAATLAAAGLYLSFQHWLGLSRLGGPERHGLWLDRAGATV